APCLLPCHRRSETLALGGYRPAARDARHAAPRVRAAGPAAARPRRVAPASRYGALRPWLAGGPGASADLRLPRRSALDDPQLRRLRSLRADLDRRRPGPLRGQLRPGRSRPRTVHAGLPRGTPVDQARARPPAGADLP